MGGLGPGPEYAGEAGEANLVVVSTLLTQSPVLRQTIDIWENLLRSSKGLSFDLWPHILLIYHPYTTISLE